MSSPEFTERHRLNEKAFTRDRKLPLPDLVRFLLNLRKGADQDELDRFFEVVCEQPLADSVSKSALTQARAKRRDSAFGELNGVLVDGAMRGLPMRRWDGFRLLAFGGSTFLLPKVPAIVEAFGQTGEVRPQGRFSRLYDVLNKVIVAADIEPLSVGEREYRFDDAIDAVSTMALFDQLQAAHPTADHGARSKSLFNKANNASHLKAKVNYRSSDEKCDRPLLCAAALP